MASEETTSNMPFIKHLASSDRRTRTKALSTLRTFLSGRSTASALTPLDHLKLWKGLFFALWMSDRPIPQQNLCEELAGLLCVLPDEAVIPWLEGYWGVMSKEWTNIDVLRMEKFLLLTRRVFGASLAWVTGGGEKLRRSRERAMLDLFEKWPMDGSGHLSRVPVGLRLHVLDIWVDEAEKAGMLDEKSTSCDLDFAEGIRKIVQSHLKSPSKPVRARAKESLADRRLAWNQRQSCLEAEDDGLKDGGAVDGWAGFKD